MKEVCRYNLCAQIGVSFAVKRLLMLFLFPGVLWKERLAFLLLTPATNITVVRSRL